MSEPDMPRATQEASAVEQAGHRVAKNAVALAVGDVVGKVASLVLFAALARELGETGLGIYVFGFAFLQIATMPVYFGFGRYLTVRLARDRSALPELFDLLTMQTLLSTPVAAGSVIAVNLLGYDGDTRLVIYVLLLGFLLDSLTQTLHSVFMAFERNELVGLDLIGQRLSAALLGIAALAAGYGVVVVAITYTVASAFALLLSLFLLARRIGMPRFKVVPRRWRQLTRSSLPFAFQDVFNVLLFRADAVILSLLATQAAVGRYGAAVKVVESTYFLTYALTASFVAMYTYLGRDTTPSLQAVFQRSIKVALAFLFPCAVTFAVFPTEICRLLFGADLSDAGVPLLILAPVVVTASIISLSAQMVVSRRGPGPMVAVAAFGAAVNIGLNIALVPRFAASGSAAGALITELVVVGIVLTLAARVVGQLNWLSMLAAPLLAAAAMAASMLVLTTPHMVVVVGYGFVVYIAAFLVLERMFSPVDLRFLGAMLRRWLPSQLVK